MNDGRADLRPIWLHDLRAGGDPGGCGGGSESLALAAATKTLTCYHLVVVGDFQLPSGLRFGRGVRLREVAQRLVKGLPAHSDSAIGLQRDVLFVDKARADKPVLFGSLELLELCPQGAEGMRRRALSRVSGKSLAATTT